MLPQKCAGVKTAKRQGNFLRSGVPRVGLAGRRRFFGEVRRSSRGQIPLPTLLGHWDGPPGDKPKLRA